MAVNFTNINKTNNLLLSQLNSLNMLKVSYNITDLVIRELKRRFSNFYIN